MGNPLTRFSVGAPIALGPSVRLPVTIAVFVASTACGLTVRNAWLAIAFGFRNTVQASSRLGCLSSGSGGGSSWKMCGASWDLSQRPRVCENKVASLMRQLRNSVTLTTNALSRVILGLASAAIIAGLVIWTWLDFADDRGDGEARVSAAAAAMSDLARSSLATIDRVIESVVA